MEAFEKIARILGPLSEEDRRKAIKEALQSVRFAERALGRRARKPRSTKAEMEAKRNTVQLTSNPNTTEEHSHAAS